MVWLLSIAALSLVALGAFIATVLRRRSDAAGVLGSTLDTRPAEDAAADNAHREGEHDASVVLRSSDDELRSEVERLAARGRSGK